MSTIGTWVKDIGLLTFNFNHHWPQGLRDDYHQSSESDWYVHGSHLILPSFRSSQPTVSMATLNPMNSPHLPTVLPQELTDMAIDFLHDDPKSLRACSLVCRDWVSPSHFHLFHKVHVRTKPFISTFPELLRRSPTVAQSIRVLELEAEPIHDTVSQQNALVVLNLLPSLNTLILGAAFTHSGSVQLYWEHPSLAVLEIHDLFCSPSEHAETARFFSHIAVESLIIRRPRLLDPKHDPEDPSPLSFARAFENWPVKSLTLEIATDVYDKPAIFFLKTFLLGLSNDSLRAFCAPFTCGLCHCLRLSRSSSYLLDIGWCISNLMLLSTTYVLTQVRMRNLLFVVYPIADIGSNRFLEIFAILLRAGTSTPFDRRQHPL